MEKLFDNIDASGDCWQWTGAVSSHGYGSFRLQDKSKLPHRLVWELLVGEIPDGLVIDHLCRNTLCMNPDHMEPVTRLENNMRGANPRYRTLKHKVCQRGHRYVGDNIDRRGKTNKCLTCKMEHDRGR